MCPNTDNSRRCGVVPLALPPSLRACNDWDKAEEILSMMKSRGVQPNEVTYTELMSICGRSGDVHQALVSWSEVKCCKWAKVAEPPVRTMDQK